VAPVSWGNRHPFSHECQVGVGHDVADVRVAIEQLEAHRQGVGGRRLDGLATPEAGGELMVDRQLPTGPLTPGALITTPVFSTVELGTRYAPVRFSSSSGSGRHLPALVGLYERLEHAECHAVKDVADKALHLHVTDLEARPKGARQSA
jgi:hypothetical protein